MLSLKRRATSEERVSRLVSAPSTRHCQVGAFLGACVGAVPSVRGVLLGSPPNLLGAALELGASAAVPIGLINLGASICSSAAPPKLATDLTEQRSPVMPLSLTLGAALLRLLIVPALSISVSYALRGSPLVTQHTHTHTKPAPFCLSEGYHHHHDSHHPRGEREREREREREKEGRKKAPSLSRRRSSRAQTTRSRSSLCSRPARRPRCRP